MSEGFQKLYNFVLAILFVSIIILTGVSILLGYEYTMRIDTTAEINNFELPNSGQSKLVGSPGQYPYLQSVSSCVYSNNASIVPSGTFTINEGDDNGGYIYVP